MKVAIEHTPNEVIDNVFANLKANELSVKQKTAQERIAILKRLRDEIKKRQADIAQAVYKDYKRSAFETDLAEVWLILKELGFAIRHLRSWIKPKRVPTPLVFIGSSSYIHYEAKGTVLIISPWNFPFNLSFAPLISAIAAGNTVMLKPSEQTPHSAKLIEEIIQAVFPSNEVCVIQGGVETSTHALSLPFNHVFFTGSPKVGGIVMESVARNLTSVTLELGGKTPVIVDKTADLKDAARKTVFSKIVNNGQVCLASDYVFVHEEVADKFQSILQAEMSDMFPRDGLDKNQDYARLATMNQYRNMQTLVSDAIEKGAKIVDEPVFINEERFISPVVISNINNDMRIANEEIFGPILPLKRFRTVDDVIQHINNGTKPLVMYTFTNSGKFRNRMLNETSSGAVLFNDIYIHHFNSYLPFGGINHSGIGKSHGYFGFLEFTNQRAVVKQWFPKSTSVLLQPPYSPFKQRLVKLIVKFFS